MTSVPSRSTKARTNGSVSVWPGYCTGVTMAKLVMVPLWGRSTSHSGPSSMASTGQRPRPPAYTRPHDGAAQPEQPVLARCLRGPVGGLGHGIAVGDRGQVVHPGHRLGRLHRCPRPRSLAASPGTKQMMSSMRPSRLPRHRGATRIPSDMASGVAGVHRVQQGRGGTVQTDECEREGMVEWMLHRRRAHPRPRFHRTRGPHLDEFVRQLGPGRRIPLHGRHQHRVLTADAQDLLLGQGGHERPDDGPEGPLVGECDGALDESGHRSLSSLEDGPCSTGAR